jgi:hypothetical protein
MVTLGHPVGHIAMDHGHPETSTSIPWATMHPPWSCLLVCHICPMGMLHWTMKHFDSSTCCPMGHCASPMVLSGTCPWEHVNCSTSVPWSFLLLHDTCPRGMFQWSMECCKCSTSFPWATVHCPWSFLLLCYTCPMGMVHWTIGHFGSSTCVPWATKQPPCACLFLCHICSMGMVEWPMPHSKCSTSAPMGLPCPA